MGYTVNLGTPYEAIIDKLIKRGYAGNRTEVIRQALIMYERNVDEEEASLVQRGVESIMSEIKSGKMKTYTYDEVKTSLAKKHGNK